MSLPIFTFEDSAKLPSKELLNAVDAFIETHYEYRCQDKYKGFFGRLRAKFDKFNEEADEWRKERERLQREDLPSREDLLKDIVFYSDPFGQEEAEKKAEVKEIKTDAEEPTFVLPRESAFYLYLKELIEVKGKSSVEVYKRANIDRKLFSKIRNNLRYIPSKRTVIALALALELSLDEANELLDEAGFTLSRNILFDVIIEYFISQGKYDLYEIDAVLFAHKQPTLI